VNLGASSSEGTYLPFSIEIIVCLETFVGNHLDEISLFYNKLIQPMNQPDPRKEWKPEYIPVVSVRSMGSNDEHPVNLDLQDRKLKGNKLRHQARLPEY
jgi:hypothetical protein